MSFDAIGSAMTMLFDELKDDEQSQSIIQKIDEAEGDDDLKEGMKAGIARLRELGKNALADDLASKTKGFI
jgi:hypothetical protein